MRQIAWNQIENLKRKMDFNPGLKSVYIDEIKKIMEYEEHLKKNVKYWIKGYK